MNETLFDLFSEYRLLVWEDELDLDKIRDVAATMASMLRVRKEKELLDRLFSEPTRKKFAVTFLEQIRQYAVIHAQNRSWNQATGLSVTDLESVVQALQHITDDAYLRQGKKGENPDWIREPHAFEIALLRAQRGSIETMLFYRVSRQLYTETIPDWEKLDIETRRQLTTSVRGKATDGQRRSTVLKVHEHIKNGLNATEAVRMALEWLHEEHRIFIEEPKTVRRWAKKLGMKWWGQEGT